MSRCAVASLAFACLVLPAAAQDVTPSQRGIPPQQVQRTAPTPVSAPGLGPDIVMVRVAGPWETGGQKGFSRLIASAAGGRIALRVEWISDAGQIVHSAAIAAAQGSEELPLARVRGESGPADSAVYFDTPQGDTLVLVVGPPGEAQFGPATN